ncbi:Uma2 family endonuclease [Tumidithrix elongata RA019]|uniref:Uma2 family endonuclease n=1 Tax=Tumidithrix elongata BACA0141 TaxID=2716417 RepID=A0AAW9PWT0_9CYAN|nr:Uma2 family endonuclease [Tumidithrix elongata RA019]
MLATPQSNYMTLEEYLEMEEKSDIKHEYIDGYVYAMAGANDPHVTITGNIFALIRSHLRGTGCRVYITDMKAHVDSLKRFYYPDVMVTCDPRDAETLDRKHFPKLIIEVLSSSTEAFDRGDKFADYQQLESLEEYVLVSTKRQRLECFRKEEGRWFLQTYSSDRSDFQLSSINFEGKFVDLYEDVNIQS